MGLSVIVGSEEDSFGPAGLAMTSKKCCVRLAMTSEESSLFFAMTMVIGNALYFIPLLWDNAKR